MNMLTEDEISWARFLAKEPSREQRRRRELFQGVVWYPIFFRRYPVRALAEVFGCALIFGLMFGMLWINEIAT